MTLRAPASPPLDNAHAQYTLATQSNSTLSTVDKTERVEFDFVASVYTRSTLSNVHLTESRPSAPLSMELNVLNVFNFGDKVELVAHVEFVFVASVSRALGVGCVYDSTSIRRQFDGHLTSNRIVVTNALSSG